jgi:RNA-directed DNA polymerase
LVQGQRTKQHDCQEIDLRLTPPEKVGKLQTALHTKAKQSPNYRFYALYDKVYRADVLAHAYRICRSNDGKPGVDRQSFRDIEEYGEERWLGELMEELKQKTYQPQPVRRVYIPKPDGKQRPLGIPTIKDRVVQTAALLVLEPIFEADLQDDAPGPSAGGDVRLSELPVRPPAKSTYGPGLLRPTSVAEIAPAAA